jgi:hypothetical protein
MRLSTQSILQLEFGFRVTVYTQKTITDDPVRLVLFAVCTSTFSKLSKNMYTEACRRVLSSAPL